MHLRTSADAELSSENEGDGLTRIGPYTICANGTDGGFRRGQPRQPVSRAQVEIVKGFLTPCKRTRWARELLSPVSSDLKHMIESWARCYISTGAVIVAALELGIACKPCGEGGRNLFIGVCFNAVSARMAERGWHVARHHVTATLIKPPTPKPDPDPEFWAKYIAENGIKIGDFKNIDDDNASADGDAFAEPHPFWAAWAKENGIATDDMEG